MRGLQCKEERQRALFKEGVKEEKTTKQEKSKIQKIFNITEEKNERGMEERHGWREKRWPDNKGL